jgi:hypothetical protein
MFIEWAGRNIEDRIRVHKQNLAILVFALADKF